MTEPEHREAIGDLMNLLAAADLGEHLPPETVAGHITHGEIRTLRRERRELLAEVQRLRDELDTREAIGTLWRDAIAERDEAMRQRDLAIDANQKLIDAVKRSDTTGEKLRWESDERLKWLNQALAERDEARETARHCASALTTSCLALDSEGDLNILLRAWSERPDADLPDWLTADTKDQP